MLPKSWNQITLKTFAELDLIVRDASLDTNDKDIQILSLLSGNTLEELLLLSFKAKRKYLNQIQFLKSLDIVNTKPRRYFRVQNKWFKLALNASEISGGQYIDLMTFLKDPEAANQNIHNVLAVIALPLKYGFLKTEI